MIRFYCRCGAETFFENSHCAVCGSLLGFDPHRQRLLPLKTPDGAFWLSETAGRRYKLCALRTDLGCNWLIPAEDTQTQCISCRLTRTIPSLDLPRNRIRWQYLEQTKRRALYMIFRLNLPVNFYGASAASLECSAPPQHPLVFDFLEDRRSNPLVMPEIVYSGHRDGVITINAAEADDSYRTAARELMNEAYRTLLGHFRHELGHYFGMMLDDAETLAAFRELFGDERADYSAALDHYYAHGAHDGWRESHISAYASAHPLEDWAETWAHYLHMRDTLETALAFNAIGAGAADSPFEYWLAEWMRLSVALNALNRSMGVDDAYPFVINAASKRKLQFIDRLVTAWRMPGHTAAGR